MVFHRNLISAAVAAALTGIAPVSAQDNQGDIEEILVTATRRAQSVEDIPYNISAISGDSIEERGIDNLSELLRSIPGLAGPDLGSRAGVNNTIVMRGLNVGDAGLSSVAGNLTASPVSTYYNETPLFSNFKMIDIERVEVLRGPQGTLYGSGAMGGTLRIISKKPDPSARSFEVTGDLSNNAKSSDLNYEFQGIANLPISDTFAVRLAIAYDKRGGVIDATNLVITDSAGNPVLADPSNVDSPSATENRKDVNGGEVKFAKIAALWQPGENTEVLFNYMRQDEDWKHGSSVYIGDDPTFGAGPDSYQDSSRALDTVERTVDLASLDINHEFGFASFTSSTSYTKDDSNPGRDTSDFYETLGAYYFFYPRMLVGDALSEKRDSFTQEFRLVSNGDSKVDWVAGLYYNESKLDQYNTNHMPGYGAWADDPNSSGSQIVAYYYGAYGLTTVGDFVEYGLGGIRPSTNDDLAFLYKFNDKFEDLAAFGEVTFHPKESWQITLGARVFKQKLKSSLYQSIPYCGPACSDDGVNPEGVTEGSNSSSFNDSIFKFNTSWDFSDDHMLYFTASQGFRRGGANPLPLVGPFADPSFPLEYSPDKALNTEIGLKGRLSNGQISYTVSAYHIDWDDIQIETFTLGGLKGVTNGDSAVSKGLELEMQANVTNNFQLGFGYSYTDAKLTGDVMLTTGLLQDGDRLPFVSKSQAIVTADYFTPVLGDKELRFHLDGNYRSGFSSEPNDFLVPSNQYYFDGFTQWNAYIGLVSDAWTFQVYVNNLSNESALSAAIVRNANSTPTAEFGRRGWVRSPRSFGLRATFRWD